MQRPGFDSWPLQKFLQQAILFKFNPVTPSRLVLHPVRLWECVGVVLLSLSPSSSLAPPLSVSFSLCPLSTMELLLTPSFGTRTQSAINSQMLYRVGEELCGFGVFFSSSLHCFLLNEEVLWCGCPCCSLELWKQWGGCYIGSVGLWASAAVRCVLLVMVRVGLWAPEVHFSLLFVCSSSFRHIRLSCDLFSFFILLINSVAISLC